MSKTQKKLIQVNRKKRNTILSFAWFLVSVAGLSLLLFGTTPDRIGPLGITLFFLLVFLSLLALGTTLRHLLQDKPGSTSHLFVILISAAGTIALAINTIELQIGDVILLVLFVATFTVYWTRLR